MWGIHMKFVSMTDTDKKNKGLNNAKETADTAKIKDALSVEFKSARRLGEVRMGETHFFYRYFIKIRYTAYDEITKAYLREESGESGEFLLKEYYLMLETKSGIMHKLRMEREEYARETLKRLENEYSHIAVGFDRLGRSK